MLILWRSESVGLRRAFCAGSVSEQRKQSSSLRERPGAPATRANPGESLSHQRVAQIASVTRHAHICHTTPLLVPIRVHSPSAPCCLAFCWSFHARCRATRYQEPATRAPVPLLGELSHVAPTRSFDASSHDLPSILHPSLFASPSPHCCVHI